MTPAQLATLRTELTADPNAVGYATMSDSQAADALNTPMVPDFWVWRTRVSKDEFTQNTSADGTVFNWTGTGFITRSQGERDAWRELFNERGFVDPSQDNVRQAFQDIFSGATAPAPANRIHLATVARRKATRAERLFATGTGTTASPGKMTFEGGVSAIDVAQARA